MRNKDLLSRESNPRAHKILYTLEWVTENNYCHICRGPCGSGRRFWGNHNWKEHRKTQYRVRNIE